jgi:hypothetical protein
LRERLGGTLVLGLLATAAVAGAYEAPHRDRRLGVLHDPAPRLRCTVVRGSSTGFYPTPTGWVLLSSVTQQPLAFTWTVAVSGNGATVTDPQGQVGTYRVTKRNPAGLVLVRAEPDAAAEVISIDAHTSSFVHSTQDANGMWNRASISVGSCE